MMRYGNPKRIKVRDELSKCFYCRAYDTLTKKQVWLSTGRTSVKAALEEKRQWELRDAAGKSDQKDVLFSKAVAAWLDFKQPVLTPRGHETYKAYCGHWLKHFPERAVVRGVTNNLVEGYFQSRGVVVSGKTLNHERSQMKQFFTWCRKRGWCEGDPLSTIPRYPEEKREIRVLVPEEEEKLLRACSEGYTVNVIAIRNQGGRAGGRVTDKTSEWQQTCQPPRWLRPLVEAAIETGLRYGTLDQLEWADIDFQGRMVRIAPSKMKAREGISVPLSEKAIAVLKTLKAEARSFKVFDLPERGDVRKAFKRAVKRAKIRPLRFHDLRASFITRCRQAGVDLEVTAALVGHRDVKTTLKFYRRVGEHEKREAIARLSGFNAISQSKAEA
ncbi:MAG: site-specific integrase [Planctomycetes bacterium]|nr:site-specific integrase [Planctomycetota bacterium]